MYTLVGESVCPMRRSAEMQGARSSAVRLLLLSCCVCAAAGYPFRTPLDLDVTPRVTVLSSGKRGHEHTEGFDLKSVYFLTVFGVAHSCQMVQNLYHLTLKH